jgi:hypothetical protein
MAVRTDDALVGGIVELDEDITVTPFITAANLLVNRICVPAKDADGDPYYTDEEELTIIETWLAAHFYCVRDARTQFEGVGPLMTRFQTQVDLNLNVTEYGQQAMLLDTSGKLAEFNRTLEKGPIKRRVGVTWLGTDPEDIE